MFSCEYIKLFSAIKQNYKHVDNSTIVSSLSNCMKRKL